MRTSAALADLPPPTERTGWPWTIEGRRLPNTMPHASTDSTQAAPWPRVSIVTPSYNQGAFLEETIRSVLLQGYPNLEYLIIDGGSIDNSVDVIRKYEPWLAYWVSEPDEGQSDAINKGFRRATGEILTWLNGDDIYLPRALRAAAEFLVEHPDASMVYGGADYVEEDGTLLSSGRVVEFDGNRPCETIIAQPAAFFRKAAFDAVGGLDTELHYRMDLDLWMRLSRRYTIQTMPYALANIRVSLDTKTSSESERTWEELALIGERYGIEAVTPAYILKERAQKHFYRGRMLLTDHQVRAARREIRKAIQLQARPSIRLKAMALLMLSGLGAPLANRILDLRMAFYNRRSNLQQP